MLIYAYHSEQSSVNQLVYIYRMSMFYNNIKKIHITNSLHFILSASILLFRAISSFVLHLTVFIWETRRNPALQVATVTYFNKLKYKMLLGNEADAEQNF